MRDDTGTRRLKALLQTTRNRDGGWPYFAGRQSRVEPTAWAMLALGLDAADTPFAAWKTSGGLLVEPWLPSPNLAFNALAALALPSAGAGRTDMSPGIVRALMRYSGIQTGESAAVQQNARLRGWPWIDGTFSWAEPTAWCTLALKKLGHTVPDAAARIQEAEQLLRDRACRNGGWNYGNPRVYGTDLGAHVPPTAVCVLAMQDRGNDDVVASATDYLRRQSGVEGSTTALALAWIALRAVGAESAEIAARLRAQVDAAEAFGNLAVASLLLYALERQDPRTPVELMLGTGSIR